MNAQPHPLLSLKPDYYARPPSYRCAINRTVVGSPSAFDTASVHLAATPQNVNHRFFLQVRPIETRGHLSRAMAILTSTCIVAGQVREGEKGLRELVRPEVLRSSRSDR